MSICNTIKNEINNYKDELIELRRYFHMYPEVSSLEYNTAKKIEEYLSKLNIPYKRVGETGVYATIKGEGKGNKSIILRADIDALPILEVTDKEYKSRNDGVMHACGHDAQTSCLLLACKLLIKYKKFFGGTVKIFFQQAEEIGYGAKVFIKEGLVNADSSFGIHLQSSIKSGKISATIGPNNASVDWFKIDVEGKSSHISTPEEGIDALYIASQIVVSAQALVTRKTNPMDNVLIGFGKLNAGEGYNIIASHASIEGSLRTLTKTMRKQMKNDLTLLCEKIATIYGGKVKITFKDFTGPLVNDDNATLLAQNLIKELLGDDALIVDRKPSLSGDDMAEIIDLVSGTYLYLGSSNPNIVNSNLPHHNCSFDIDEDCLINGALLYTSYAIKFLNEED